MPQMCKNMAIFCDGTWQNLNQRYPTNVAKLARTVCPQTARGNVQFVYYDDGVGVGQGFAGAVTHVAGGIAGDGLDYKIARAYEFLCLNYNPGDRIFIFGFSRGAYTAQSLAGLLRLIWILKRKKASLTHAATAFCRTRPRPGASQADQRIFQAALDEFRADHCYAETPFVEAKAYDPTDSTSLIPANNSAWIQYLGVWDTVGSLGLPSNLPFAEQLDARYQFHDTSLSRFVRSARHAVSIDERHNTLTPTLWDNISALNVNAHASGLAYTNRPYQQIWFPGGHASVGGGHDDGGVSLPALLWVAEGAARAGLAFDDHELRHYGQHACPEADFRGEGSGVGEFFLKLSGLSDRKGPDSPDEVSTSARLRWARLPTYRPNPLSRVAVDLDEWQPPTEPLVYYAP